MQVSRTEAGLEVINKKLHWTFFRGHYVQDEQSVDVIALQEENTITYILLPTKTFLKLTNLIKAVFKLQCVQNVGSVRNSTKTR